MSTWSSSRSSRPVKRTSSSIKALSHFAERGSQSLPDWATGRLDQDDRRGGADQFPFAFVADLANGGHAGDAAGGLDDGDLEAREQESGIRSQRPGRKLRTQNS